MEGPLIITKFLFDEEKKTIVKDVFFSLIMSFITVLSKNAIEEHLFLNKYNMAQYALLFVVYNALFYLSIRVIALIRKRAMTGTVVADTVKLPRVKLFLLMFAAWTPYLLVFLPGVANYDTVNQVNDFFDGVSPVPFGFVKGQETVNVFLNAHHPIVPTFIFSFFIWIGVILGSATMGFLLYIIFPNYMNFSFIAPGKIGKTSNFLFLQNFSKKL